MLSFINKPRRIILGYLFLCGCPMMDGVIYEPMYYVNTYYENGSVSLEGYVEYINYRDKNLGLKWIKLSSNFLGNPVKLELSEKGRWASPILNLVVRANDNCILYSYSREQLQQLKTQAGFDKESDDAVFMIGKDRITVVSKAEYERLKPTFAPSPYDASLCQSESKE